MKQLTSDLSQALYAAIGKVTCEWAHLETTVRYYVQAVTGLSFETSVKLTAGLTSVALFDLVLSLLHSAADENDDTQLQLFHEFKAARKVFDELREERNRVVHRDWLLTRPGGAAAFEAAARGRKIKTVKLGVREMEQIATRIHQFNQALWEHILDAMREHRVVPKHML